jgi:hypothetical protein
MANPKWWSEEHDSTWDRVKAAMKRDWEQTKADITRKGPDLEQDVDDTVKQAMGKQPIPPGNMPVHESHRDVDDDDWSRAELGYRYGVGARSQYGREHPQWDDNLERKLRTEWSETNERDTWDEVKAAVRRGWDRVAR